MVRFSKPQLPPQVDINTQADTLTRSHIHTHSFSSRSCSGSGSVAEAAWGFLCGWGALLQRLNLHLLFSPHTLPPRLSPHPPFRLSLPYMPPPLFINPHPYHSPTLFPCPFINPLFMFLSFFTVHAAVLSHSKRTSPNPHVCWSTAHSLASWVAKPLHPYPHIPHTKDHTHPWPYCLQKRAHPLIILTLHHRPLSWVHTLTFILITSLSPPRYPHFHWFHVHKHMHQHTLRCSLCPL